MVLQLNANRNIALTDSWEKIIVKFQKARIMMGVILLFLSIAYYLNKDFIYLLFLAAPIIALKY